ncbi:glycosyltransferase family 4 protein [Vibrio campbellii]|uniref:glycosyltransferase family 4 protein n=1 Tax=Vibrio campbellii TaxID=680 RepID=UPI0005EDD1EA|nr:glycosyltransferase family 4 protein [Vibrio campbellii]
MKVAVIIPLEEPFDSYHGGAVARWVYHVYKEIDNIEYDIFSSNSSSEYSYPLPSKVKPFFSNLNILSVNMCEFFSKNGRGKSFVKKVLTGNGKFWINSISNEIARYDLVHIHNRPYYALWLRERGYSGKIILHMHNSLKSYINESTKHDVFNAVDEIIFCSKYMQSEGLYHFDGMIKKSYVVYNGIEQFSSLNEKTNHSNRVKLVHSGRLVPEKGADKAISIASKLLELGYNIELSIIGGVSFGNDGVTGYSKTIKKLAAEVNSKYSNNPIKILGYMHHTEMMTYFKNSDVFLYPVEWDEPFGMVIIEAMANSMFVISRYKGGIPEIISNNEIGLLVKSDDDSELVQSCIDILSNKEKMLNVSNNAMVYVKEKFHWKEISSSLMNILIMK